MQHDPWINPLMMTDVQRVALSGCCSKQNISYDEACFECFGDYFTKNDLTFEMAVQLIQYMNRKVKECR